MENGIVSVTIQGNPGKGSSLIVALYAQDESFLDAEIFGAAEGRNNVKLSLTDAQTVSVLLLDADGQPLCQTLSKTL